MVDLPDSMVDLPDTMVDLPDTMVDLRGAIVTVPPLVVLPLLDDRPRLVVDHPREATVCLVSLEQSSGVKTGTLK